MLELDGRGFIKGTNELYKGKVVALVRFGPSTNIHKPGDIFEMQGDALVTALEVKNVRLFNEETDGKKTSPKTDPELKTVKTYKADKTESGALDFNENNNTETEKKSVKKGKTKKDKK